MEDDSIVGPDSCWLIKNFASFSKESKGPMVLHSRLDTVQDAMAAMEVESMGDEDPGELTLEKTFSNDSLEMSPGKTGWMRESYVYICTHIAHTHTDIYIYINYNYNIVI